jgi:hypothetical protein
MTAITGPGYWRVTQDGAELLSDDEGQQLLAEGGTSVVRIEQRPDGALVGFQNSGAGLSLPSGQTMAHSAFTTLWNHE